MRLVPAVVVGHGGERRVGDFRLARQLRLGQIGHADDIHAPAAVQVRLSLRRELRPLNHDVCSLRVNGRANFLRACDQNHPELLGKRIGKRNVRDDPVGEETRLPCFIGPVDELVRNDKVQRLHLFSQTAAGRNRNDRLDAELFHPVDISAVVELARRDAVPSPVTREEHNLCSF